MIKRCSKCGEYLPICLFRESSNPNWEDGHGKTCFICQNKNYVVVDRYKKGEDLIKDIFENIARKKDVEIRNSLKKELKKERKRKCEKKLETDFKKNYKKKGWDNLEEEIIQDLIIESILKIKAEVEANPTKYDYKLGTPIYGIIYYVHNRITDRYYVGQTTRSFDLRYPEGFLKQHIKLGNKLLQKDLELYGEESFEFNKIFKVASNQYELDKIEAYFIDKLEAYTKGYNRTRGNWFTDRGLENKEG